MTDAEPDDFDDAVGRLHQAMAHVAMGDVDSIKALHSHADDVTSFYGWGGFELGWEAVSRRWDWAATQFKDGTVSYQGVSRIVGQDLALTTDIETFCARRPTAPEPVSWSNRVTHVFRRENGSWRLVHRHANRLETNPAA